MTLDPIRVYLLSGLALHKAVWEILKRRNLRQAQTQSSSSVANLARAAKITILIGMLLQSQLPAILPLSQDTGVTRPAGVAMFTMGLLLALIARVQLGRQWSDIEVASVAKDHMLIDRGIYGLIRHPIYTGDLLLLTGFELALNSWLIIGVVALVAVVWRKADNEEKSLVAQLPSYRGYLERTKRFVPFVV